MEGTSKQNEPERGYRFSRWQLLGFTAGAAAMLGIFKLAFTTPTTVVEYVANWLARAMLMFMLCPPCLPLLWLLRREARRLDDHRK